MITSLIITISVLYVLLILLLAIGLRKSLLKKEELADSFEKISVVIPFRNEEKKLPYLLDALLSQSLPKEYFELILVNDHSDDNSLNIVEHYNSVFTNLSLISLSVGEIGKKAALMKGIEKSSNPFIAFTDADCEPSRQWLKSISKRASSGIDFIVGNVIMECQSNISSKFQSLEYASLMATAAGSCGLGHPIITSSSNLGFRKSLFLNNNELLNPSLSSGDDVFLLHKAKKIDSCKIVFMNNISSSVVTSSEPSLKQAINQRKRWASKSIHYKDFDTILASLVVLLFNLMLLILSLSSIIDIRYLFALLILLAIKSIVDLVLLKPYLKFNGKVNLLQIFIPLQLLYPIYVAYSFVAGIIFKGNWKGRKVS